MGFRGLGVYYGVLGGLEFPGFWGCVEFRAFSGFTTVNDKNPALPIIRNIPQFP